MTGPEEYDLVWLVLDSLRYDVAMAEMQGGRTPNFASLFPGGWEKRHSPGSFTYAAHQAFFAGFLPTPADPAINAERSIAVRFPASKTIGANTLVVEGPDVVTGLAARGYHTLCIGGVGFFDKRTALGRVLPGYFQESYWSPETGVMSPTSTEKQFALAASKLPTLPQEEKLFLFINVSAIHSPNYYYLRSNRADDLDSHAAALHYVDHCLPVLLEALRKRARPSRLLVFSDHGTLYGEDGFTGHRIGHPEVYTVPYAETMVTPASAGETA